MVGPAAGEDVKSFSRLFENSACIKYASFECVLLIPYADRQKIEHSRSKIKKTVIKYKKGDGIC